VFKVIQCLLINTTLLFKVTVPELYLSYVLENINKKPLEKLLPWSKGMPEYTKQDLNKYM